MKPNLEKLYAFAAKLAVALEEELDALRLNKLQNTVSVKKNITETLNKLVILINRINKMNVKMPEADLRITEEDGKIIERFLARYNMSHIGTDKKEG